VTGAWALGPSGGAALALVGAWDNALSGLEHAHSLADRAFFPTAEPLDLIRPAGAAFADLGVPNAVNVYAQDVGVVNLVATQQAPEAALQTFRWTVDAGQHWAAWPFAPVWTPIRPGYIVESA